VAEFSPAARAAIIEAGGGRCVGCGSPDITVQHRRRRGMGGSKDPAISTPANGLPLCGHGTAGCHGWTEHNPTTANLLGWALTVGEDQLVAPWWSRFGWRVWTVEDIVDRVPGSLPGESLPFYAVAFVFDEDLDQREARELAVDAWHGRGEGWRL
jgi:5-methylcytosine-specific restriction protein A